MRGLDLVAVLLLIASTASAQTTLYELKSGEPDDDFGTCIANVGDVDRDGFADLGVGAPRSDLGGVNAGAAYVYSGRTGLRLHLFLGTKDIRLGSSLCAADDVDLDGFADVLVGAPWSNKGHASIYSGLTGKVIRTHVGIEQWDGFGNVVGSVGDIDADGLDDYAVTAADEPLFDYVQVYSGRSGSLLHTHGSPIGFSTFLGRAFLALGDLDDDGYGDYAIGEPTGTGLGGAHGDSWVWVYSGQTGQVRFGLFGSTTSLDLFGTSLASPGDLDGDGKSDIWVGAPVGRYAQLYGGVTGTDIVQEHHGRGTFGTAVTCADVDGDGRRDLLVGAPGWSFQGQKGFVEIFSSTNGATLLKLEGQHAFEGMGTSLATLGDLNGDGREEFAVGSLSRYVRVVSPVDLSLSSPQPHPLVSVSTGGAVDFELDTRPDFASLFYLLLGSASGTSPAVPLAPGVALPLVPDGYMQSILQSLGSPAFDGFFGTLDGNGNASARLDLAGGVDPSLVGITLHHAFAVFDPSGSAIFASNAVASSLIPDPLEVPSCYFPAPPLESAGTYLVFDGSAGVDPNGSSVVHTWDFGDGSSATGVAVTHAYASQGLYDVQHRVEDTDANASTCSLGVAAEFCFEVTPFSEGWLFETIGFGGGSVAHFVWDFGDGASLQTDFATTFHSYAEAGTYTVALTLTFVGGATSTCIQTVVVLPSASPDCEFDVTPFLAGWLFDAGGSSRGQVDHFVWDFGDGASIQTDSTTAFHQYAGPGAFTVTLTRVFQDGAVSICSEIVVVPSTPPDCEFEVTPFLGSWYFEATGSGEGLGEGLVEHYAWDFGDGTSSETDAPSVFHPYSSLGTFTVTLTRTFFDGATSICSQDVVVLESVPADCQFHVTPIFGTWIFDASGDGDGFVEQYAWDFGDGTSMLTDFAGVTHKYSGPGTYTVTLTLTYLHEAPTSTCTAIVVVP